METRVVDNAELNRYELYVDGDRAGAAEYHHYQDELAVLHTEVDPSLEGKGLGGVLARHLLDDARQRGLKVLPYCGFIRGWIGKHPDYLDLVPESSRDRFGL